LPKSWPARAGNAQAERGGTSALDLATRLVPDGPDRFVLSGTKYYCTGALTAHWIPSPRSIRWGASVLAYVPRHAPGVTVEADWNAMGQRTTYSGTVHLDGVSVAAAQVVAHWQLFDRHTVYHPLSSLLHAAIDVGIAGDALAEGVALIRARSRPRLGAAVSGAQDDPLLLLALGQLSTRLHAAEALLQRAAGRLDAAVAAGVDADNAALAAVEVGEAKAFAEDVALAVSNEIFALIGSAASDEGRNLNRHWRNARTHTIHDANQWRFHAAGNWLLNGVAPGKPLRKRQ
jgi:alkylation response protein AidB-like acyl-CoA dehydrogenase